MQVEYKEGVDRPVGVVQAVLCESVDLGVVDDKFSPGKKKHECVFIWQLAESAGTWMSKEGKRSLFLQSKIFRVSLNEKANLRKIVEGMIGKALTLENGKKVELNKLNNTNCMLTISKPENSSYTKIDAAAPLMKGLTKIAPKDYVRPEWIATMLIERKQAAAGVVDSADDNVDVSDIAATL